MLDPLHADSWCCQATEAAVDDFGGNPVRHGGMRMKSELRCRRGGVVRGLLPLSGTLSAHERQHEFAFVARSCLEPYERPSEHEYDG